MVAPDFTFIMHHVGARGGSNGFLLPEAFHADAMNILYDADAECLNDIQDKLDRHSIKTVVLPFALGARPERRVFNLHLHPFTNSFQVNNPRYAAFNWFERGRDYILSEATRPLRHAELEVNTIDALVRDAARPVPAPDFLLIDTEGTDYEVLAGARNSLRMHGLAVTIETQFQPLWRGQHLFGDVWKLMDELGFDLASMHLHGGLSPNRVPVGLRGRGFQTACDALFLRRVESLVDAVPDPDQSWIKIRKLAFTAILLGQVEYGIKALAAAKQIAVGADVRAAAASVSYARFLDSFDETAARMPARFPPTLAEDFDPARATVRPVREPIPPGLKGRIKAALLHHPALLRAVRCVRIPALRFFADARQRAKATRRRWFGPRATAFERLLLDHGLVDVAEIVQARRLQEEPYAR